MATIVRAGFVCQECAYIIANGCDAHEYHSASNPCHGDTMDAAADIVLSACAEDCQHHTDRDDCEFDLEFSRVACMTCPTDLAGNRFAAVEFA